MNKYCIFIQARMSSSRTPGKVLEDIEGKPMLLRQIQRLQKSNKDIMLACVTSTDIQDNATKDNLYLEHIIPWFHNHPNQFKTLQVNSSEDLHRPKYYLTVDYPEDLIVVKKIFNGMKDSGDFFTFKDLISFCDLHPEILSINKHLHQGFDI